MQGIERYAGGIYSDKSSKSLPRETAVVDLNRYPAPNLVVEIAVSSLLDHQDNKRSRPSLDKHCESN